MNYWLEKNNKQGQFTWKQSWWQPNWNVNGNFDKHLGIECGPEWELKAWGYGFRESTFSSKNSTKFPQEGEKNSNFTAYHNFDNYYFPIHSNVLSLI